MVNAEAVTIAQASRGLDPLVELLESGQLEYVVLMRDGKMAARLVPARPVQPQQEGRTA